MPGLIVESNRKMLKTQGWKFGQVSFGLGESCYPAREIGATLTLLLVSLVTSVLAISSLRPGETLVSQVPVFNVDPGVI